MSNQRHLTGVKDPLSDVALQAVIESVEDKLGKGIIDARFPIHPTDCRCNDCWVSFQKAWVKDSMGVSNA